jgi:hypothetical protein
MQSWRAGGSAHDAFTVGGTVAGAREYLIDLRPRLSMTPSARHKEGSARRKRDQDWRPEDETMAQSSIVIPGVAVLARPVACPALNRCAGGGPSWLQRAGRSPFSLQNSRSKRSAGVGERETMTVDGQKLL